LFAGMQQAFFAMFFLLGRFVAGRGLAFLDVGVWL